MTAFKEQLIAYANKKYKAQPKHLWMRYPGYTVLRHSDNQKWFALMMDLPAGKLGLDHDEVVDKALLLQAL